MGNSKNKFFKEITPLTLAVLPEHYENGYLGAKIMEKDETYSIHETPTKVIDLACRFFGGDLHGKQTGTTSITNWTHKLPIVIDPYSALYFFPTTSPTNRDCAWIAHTHVETIEPYDNQQTKVYFSNEQSLVVDVSYGSMFNQVNRTAQFRFILERRLKSLHRTKDSDNVPDIF